MKKKILIIGSNGMAGHLIADFLSFNPDFEIIRIARYGSMTNYKIDVTDFNSIEKLVYQIKPNYIINAIGILNSDAENNPDRAVLINSYFPHFLAKICDNNQTKLIHISTDCVFNGKKGDYFENDFKDGYGFYAQSKALGEVCYNKHLTIRTSIIGPDLKSNGIGLLNWVLSQRNQINGYEKAYWSGVTTLELAKSIQFFIENEINDLNLYHLTNNKKISKYKLIEKINDVFNLNLNLIPNHVYEIDKSLINTNKSIDYKVPSYSVMIEEMYNWISKNIELYPHYNIR
jgi:dTDP-4-dehydrorhamnose reductase